VMYRPTGQAPCFFERRTHLRHLFWSLATFKTDPCDFQNRSLRPKRIPMAISAIGS
jgi:hypothetical protein